MVINFGEHKGKDKLVETVILKEPALIMWILNKKDADGPLVHIRKEVLRLIKIFDSKPFIKKCVGCHGRLATRFSLAHPSSPAYWWCDVCNPCSMGCDSHLTVGRTYENALQYAKLFPHSFDLKCFIKEFAEAKGLPRKVGAKQAVNFFIES